MGPSQFDVRQMLEVALAMEEKGYKFYGEAFEKTPDGPPRQMVRMLQAEELVHMKRIKVIYDQVSKGQNMDEAWHSHGETSGDITRFFRELARRHAQKLYAGPNELEVVETAIGFEAESIEYYESKLDAAADPVVRKFLEAMVGEERGHHKALVDLKLYLTRPDAYFADLESPSFDGG